jgi:hypothetical protein
VENRLSFRHMNLSFNKISGPSVFCEKQIPTFEHDLYSPDFVPCKVFLLSKMISYLKENHFQSNEYNHKKTAVLSTALSQNGPRGCFKARMAFMKLHVASEGKYFDAKNIHNNCIHKLQ